jgi:hypothetical protein
MKAELVFLGKSIDMAPRAHRRALVVLIYAGLAALMALAWVVDGWHETGVYLVFATLLVNRLFLGGYVPGGLIKPFNGKAPRRSEAPPPFLMLALRVYQPAPEESEFRSDEREMRQRDRAHYQAYQVLAPALTVMWLLASWKLHAPRLLAWIPASADVMLYGLVLAAVVVSVTLPQAILLWTEPDMEAEGEQVGV